ncbi:MAG: hypothetical protein AAGM22_23250 [Acidobacteriota bacterium]
MPYYLLIIGDPTAVPLGFQFDLALQHAVGRVALDSPAAYGRYARSVLSAEEHSNPRSLDLEVFSVGHEGDEATALARKVLVGPTLKRLAKAEELTTRHVDGQAATKGVLSDAVAAGESSLLFAVSHAALFSPQSPRQRPCQGALVCADWPGTGPASASQYFAASDLNPDADLTGRLLFLFGCHTAGTPHLDSFGVPGHGSRRRRRQLAPAPFIAALPSALLSHPAGGALAVIAHVDRAFPQHLFGPLADGQSRVFESVLRQLLMGQRVGFAMESFGHRHGELAARLLAQAFEAGDGDFDPLDGEALWTAYNDARSHIILGDPAVRLDAGSG